MSEDWQLSDEWIEAFNDHHSGGVHPSGDPVVVLGMIIAEAPPGTGPSVYVELFDAADESELMWATRTGVSDYVAATAPLASYAELETVPLREILTGWYGWGSVVKVDANPQQMAMLLAALSQS